tara:strand:+ start:222 stop:461 length:240 start_codon:yes stop_codon:yes gene_type:complete
MSIFKIKNGYLEGFTVKLDVSEDDSKAFICSQAVRQALTLLDQLNLSFLSRKVRDSNFIIKSDRVSEGVTEIEEVDFLP